MGGSEQTNDFRHAPHLGAAAEQILARAFGGPVRLAAGQNLRDKYRNRVLRCAVEDAPAGVRVPASVVVKACVGEADTLYDAHKDEPEQPAWRFCNEWAGARFLQGRVADPPLSARCWGADPDRGVLVLEDLGSGPALSDKLQGDDPGAATEALTRYAASLGRLHARTAGAEAEWRRLRAEASGADPAWAGGDSEVGDWLRKSARPFRERCEQLGVAVAAGFDRDAKAVHAAMTAPGPFAAFAPGDTCPDNHRLPAGAGGYLRFFDFEFAGFRHALLDAAYLISPFPTCWCVARLPDGLAERLTAAYREELAAGCPPAGDDALFAAGLTCAAAHWAVWSVNDAFSRARKENAPWGVSTVRQRHPLRLDNFAALAERHDRLPALAQTARALAARLRQLWPAGEAEMPLYPPFRGLDAAERPAPAG